MPRSEFIRKIRERENTELVDHTRDGYKEIIIAFPPSEFEQLRTDAESVGYELHETQEGQPMQARFMQ